MLLYLITLLPKVNGILERSLARAIAGEQLFTFT